MSLFSLLEYEEKIQIGDKTRLYAGSSFASKAVNEITSLTIAPGIGESAVEVFSPDKNDVYLDWVYESLSFDIDSTNNTLLFNEGGATLTATLSGGNYTISTLATEIKTQMDSAGALTYTVTVSSDNKITIAATGAYELEACEILSQLSFEITGIASASQQSDVVEYGVRKITVVSDNGSVTDTKSFYQKVYTSAGDRLFCSDHDLTSHEPDLMKWVPQGRSSYKDVIRRSQGLIVAWMDEKGYVNAYQDKYTKWDIADLEEVRQWSIFQTLKLIMQGLSNVTDDVFDKKAKEYSKFEEAARQRVILRIDVNKDGTVDATEGVSISSGSIYRR